MREYFEEAKKWYYFKYVSHIKFLMFIASITIFMSLLVIFVFYVVQGTISSQERVAKVIRISYEPEMRPSIQKLDKHHHSNDLNILQYSIESYINNFEVYEKTDNYYISFIEKMKHLQKHSSREVMKAFQNRFASEYSTKLKTNAFVKLAIKDIDFNIAEESLIEKFRNLLMAQSIPDQATIDATLYIFDGKKLEKKPIRIEINFFFEKVQKQKNGQYNNVKFFVTNYSYSNAA